MHIDDLGKRLAEHWKKNSFARQPEVIVLHRRRTDDRCQVRRVLSMREAGQVENRIVVGLRVEAGVVAERTFAASLARLDVAFEHDVRARRDFEVDADAFDDLDPPPREKAAEQQFVEALRHRRGCAVGEHWLGAERDRNLEPPAQSLGYTVMLGAAFVALEVHPGRPPVEHLHAVRADVAHAGLGIFREYERERNEASAVFRPALENGACRRAARLHGTARP